MSSKTLSATEKHYQYRSSKHFPGLDGLRALAIVSVVWHHSVRPDFWPSFARGFLGVDLFFVLSGFLIATLLAREKERNGRISLTDFWTRRFLRLMPAYYLLLFCMLGALLLLKPGDPATEKLVNGFHIYALYLSNWFHPGAPNLDITWSLSTEEQFYIVWPLVEAFFASFVAAGLWIVALVTNQLINFGVLDPLIDAAFGPGASQREILDVTFAPILLGVGLAHLLHRSGGYEFALRAVGFRYAPLVFAALLFGLLNVPTADISGLFRLTLHILMTLWIASVVLAPTSHVTSVLEWRPLVFIGSISYGIYLYHVWAIHIARMLVDKTGLSQLWLQFPLSLAGSLVIAAVSFYCFEKRFLDLRGRFRR